MNRDVLSGRLFLKLGLLFEGGLAAFALALAWLLAVDLRQWFSWNWQAVAWGVAGTVPIFALFLISQWLPLNPLVRVKRFLIEMLGPALVASHWTALLLVAGAAGLGEELLFRGVLQPWMSRWGPAIGLIGSNVLFALAHCITPTYAVLAGMIGVYLGLLLKAGGEANLLTPIITHGLYDFLAFLVVRRIARQEQAGGATLSEGWPQRDNDE